MSDTVERAPAPAGDDPVVAPGAAGPVSSGPQAPDAQTLDAQGPGPLTPAPRRPATRGRLVRWGALVAAVGTVVALDTGAVPLPYSTPAPAAPAAVVDPGSRPAGDSLAAVEAREEGIRATVTALDAALDARDEAALTALVDPAEADTADRLRRMLANLAVLPDAELGVYWGATWSLDQREGNGDPFRAVVADLRLSVRIPGYDEAAGSVAANVGMRVVGDRWLVSSWEQPGGTNLWPAERMAPWDADVELAVVEKPHVLVIGAAGNARANARLASRLEAAAVDARKVWTTDRWNGRVVVVAVDEEAFLDAWFAPGEGSRGGEEANHTWTFGLPDEEDLYEFSEPHAVRTVLAADFLAGDDRWLRWSAREIVTHTVLESLEADRIPAWLYRGAAEYVAVRPSYGRDVAASAQRWALAPRTRSRIRAGTWEPTLVVDGAEFADGGEADADRDWDSAFLGAMYVADEHGEKALQRLVVRSSESGFDLAVEDVLGVDAEEFAEAVAGYARSYPGAAG